MRSIIPILMTAMLAVGASGASQTPPESGMTRDQADAILGELRAIRQLLEKQQAPTPSPTPAVLADPIVSVSLEDSFVMGSKDAPVTMIEFTDYQCPFCQQFHKGTFSELRKKYIDTGKVRFVSRDLPLDMHANAPRAAEAARCAGDQGQFWKLRDMMIANPNKLSLEDIRGYALKLSLEIGLFESCMETRKYQAAVEQDTAAAAGMNITGTPTFVVGKSTESGVTGPMIVGAQSLATFEAKIAEAMPAK